VRACTVVARYTDRGAAAQDYRGGKSKSVEAQS
jgi:hypothetical protein